MASRIVSSRRFLGFSCTALLTAFFGLAGAAAANDGVDTAVTGGVAAGQATHRALGSSGLPLPRFATLKSGNVNLRVGPGKEHPILWNYVKAGLPVEIVLEFDTWRKIRDSEGVEGWVYQSMLSGKRRAIVEPWKATRADGIASIIEASTEAPENVTDILARPEDGARVVAQLEAGVMLDILTCDGVWCSVAAGGHSGWIRQTALWGVYPRETIDE